MQKDLGFLRHRIAIQNISTTAQDSFGEFIPAWTTARTVWGSIEPTAGKERFQGNEAIAQCTHFIRMRYQSGITLTQKSRLQYGSRNFNVMQVNNVQERNAELEILAIEDST